VLNAAKPPVWRAWLLLAVACWLGVAPAASVTFAPAFGLRGPETRVWDFFPTSTESGRETAPQVADSHLEKVGSGYELVSGVCVYLYAHADPVRFSDPSGHSVFTSSFSVAFSIYTKLLYLAVPAVAIGHRGITAINNARLYQFFQNVSINSFTNSSRLPALVRAAEIRHPALKGYDNHHVLPQFIVRAWADMGVQLARPWAQIQVRMSNAYHQVIHNKINDAIEAAKLDIRNPAHVNRVLDVIEKVFVENPLN